MRAASTMGTWKTAQIKRSPVVVSLRERARVFLQPLFKIHVP